MLQQTDPLADNAASSQGRHDISPAYDSDNTSLFLRLYGLPCCLIMQKITRQADSKCAETIWHNPYILPRPSIRPRLRRRHNERESPIRERKSNGRYRAAGTKGMANEPRYTRFGSRSPYLARIDFFTMSCHVCNFLCR